MIVLLIPILVGWALGFIVNYLADVLPMTRRLSRPACPECGVSYPLLDYLLGMRCRRCGGRRSLRIWIVLLLMAILSAYIWIHPPARSGFAIGIIILTYFATVFVIDMEHRLILHITSIVGSILGLGAGWLSHGLFPTLLGGLGGLLIMLGLYFLGVLFSRFRTRRMQALGHKIDEEESLGAGDVILAGILGLALGWPLIWFGLLMGILLGGAYGLLLVLYMFITQKNKGRALMVFMPYGPFFIMSAFFIIYLPGLVLQVVPK
jgi:prepilin signal peptidase PulO-like enzyme (type II secretory pathway)